jgi:hypothetical protein
MADKEQETFTAEEVKELIRLFSPSPMTPILIWAGVVMLIAFLVTLFK